MRDYYKILGIRSDATQAEIKEAWNFSIKAFHPDKFAGSSQIAAAPEKKVMQFAATKLVKKVGHFALRALAVPSTIWQRPHQ